MKVRIIASILTIMPLFSLPFIFLFSIQTDSQKDKNENCDSSYPDACIPPHPPDLNCDDISHNLSFTT